MAEPHGPPIHDDEQLHRALIPSWYPNGRLSSAAFTYDKFSVDVASKGTIVATVKRLPRTVAIAEFNCGDARSLEFDAREEIDENYPENQAHAHVYFPGGSSKRKRHARALVEKCEIVWTRE